MKLSKVMAITVFMAMGLRLLMLAQSQTVLTVCPSRCDFDRIQSAVYAAVPGATILIKAPGLYYENLAIRKSLTIKADSEALPILILSPRDEESRNKPTILIESTSPIEVSLENLTIWGFIDIRGQAKLTASEVHITHGRTAGGLNVYDRAQVTLRNSKISDSGPWGAFVSDSAQLKLIGSAVFSTSVSGLLTSGQAQLWLINSAVYSNLSGIDVNDMSKVIIENSFIHDHPSVGISASESSVVEVLRSTIANNRTHGIFLADNVNFVLKESFVYGNGGWGVYAWLRKCGEPEDRYTGTPYVDETNVIVKNGQGDVCLP